MISALNITEKVARLDNWDFTRNYVVHQVYKAEDFVFLRSETENSSVTFKGSGEVVRNFIKGGISSELSRISSHGLSIEVTDKAGAAPGEYNESSVVMQLFRVKRNGEIYRFLIFINVKSFLARGGFFCF